MVWIPSALWFEYLAVRVDELEYAQLRVNRQNPPNRGVLTSLLCHLIREVSSTDLIPAAHVRQSLALLQAQTVMNSFGALFLHTLNFDIEVIIPELQEFDDEAVLRSLKFSRGKPRRTRRQGPQQLNLPSVQYPLGPAPAWSEVMQAIDCDPTGFVDPFICPTWLDVNEVASRLFMQFTVQLYALLNDEWTLESTISPLDSLQDAMMFWTLEGMQKHLARVAFTATNGGLRGSIHGHKELSFRARASIFFPSFFDNNIRKGSQWHVFTGQMGYIRHYHSTLESCTEEEAADLHTALEDIFSYVQVLPFASAPTQDGHGTVWSRQGERVRIVVNPAYYKMDKIGSGPTKRRGGPQLTIGATKFLKKLAEGSRIGIPDIQALHRVHNNLRKVANKSRSTNALNKRKPPKTTNRIGTSASAVHQQHQRLVDQDEDEADPPRSDDEEVDEDAGGDAGGDPMDVDEPEDRRRPGEEVEEEAEAGARFEDEDMMQVDEENMAQGGQNDAAAAEAEMFNHLRDAILEGGLGSEYSDSDPDEFLRLDNDGEDEEDDEDDDEEHIGPRRQVAFIRNLTMPTRGAGEVGSHQGSTRARAVCEAPDSDPSATPQRSRVLRTYAGVRSMVPMDDPVSS